MPTMPAQKPGRSKQDYQTPPKFLAAVKQRLHITDFYRDLAADENNTVASRFYTQEQNSLVQPWGLVKDNRQWAIHEWQWLNPPFAKLEPWVRKAHIEGQWAAQTVMLVPAGVGSHWWERWVHEKARVLFLSPRLIFPNCPVNPKTGKIDPYPKDLALLLYGPAVTPGYECWRWK